VRRLSTVPWVRGRTDRFRRHRLRARRRGRLRSPFLCADQLAMTSNEEHVTLRTQRHGAYETIRACQAKFLIRRCPRGPVRQFPLGIAVTNACPHLTR
jgi:hypothetical protein